MHKRRWSDFEFVLAVATEGSAAAAARALGVNHATVIRRVRAFEANWPEPVFEHRQEGYRLTESGKAFLEAAQTIDSTLSDLEHRAHENQELLSGNVKVTTTDSLLPILAREIVPLRQAYPSISLDVFVTNQRLNLFNRDADIALRPSKSPPEELIGRWVGVLRFGLFSPSHMEERSQLEPLPIISFGDPMISTPMGREIAKVTASFKTGIRTDSFLSAYYLAIAGYGCAILPVHLGDSSPLLRRIPMEADISTDLWLLAQKDALRAARIRASADFLFHRLKKHFA